MTPANLFLFPRPRVLELAGQGPPISTRATVALDTHLGPEAFVIDIGTDEILIRGGGPPGIRYAEAVMDSIRVQSSHQLPALHLEDFPDFAVRGYLLDISRDRVPTRDTLLRLVELMTRARMNHLELYTEHTFSYSDHEVVWQGASPMTPADIVWLDGVCHDAGIELVPNQACFGHMSRWLSQDGYRWRAETPSGFELMPGLTLPPATLAPTSENADFVLGLLTELLTNFTSRQVHVNCDETFELGRGVSAARAAEIGKGALFVEHVNRIVGPLLSKGHQVLMWADMLQHDPLAARALMPGTIPIAWWYEAPLRPGTSIDLPERLARLVDELGTDAQTTGFDHRVEPLAEAGVPFWVAPGTSSWSSLVGRIDNARENLLDAAAVGRAYGSVGYLVTYWGDDGHIQPPSISFGPLLFGGAVAWNESANASADIADILDRVAFDDPQRRLGAAVRDMGLLWCRTGQRSLNGSPLHSAVVEGAFALSTGQAEPALLAEVVERLDGAIDAITAATPHCSDSELVKRELVVAAGLARQGAWAMLDGLGEPVPKVRKAQLGDLIDQQRDAWLARARPGGLAESIGRLERTRDQIRA